MMQMQALPMVFAPDGGNLAINNSARDTDIG
jgi:hypothetical protein